MGVANFQKELVEDKKDVKAILGKQWKERRFLQKNCPVLTEQANKDTKKLFSAIKSCGYYKSIGCNYEVIPANVVHPGEGPGDLDFKPYIVQFDIGIHPNIRGKVMKSLKDKDAPKKALEYCVGCKGSKWTKVGDVQINKEGETCLELIVKGNSDFSDGCTGKCGSGCIVGAGWAKDCMKHDVCTAVKNTIVGDFYYDDGFCYDPDCGDEAATTIMNCWKDRGLFLPDKHLICKKESFKDKDVYGHWSHATGLFDEGPCNNFNSWSNGQGIPDKNQISNSYRRAGLERFPKHKRVSLLRDQQKKVKAIEN